MDFEYKFNQKRNYYYLICGVIKTGSKEPIRYDLRNLEGQKAIIQFLSCTHQDDIFVAYNVAGAEGKVLTQLMGVNFMLKTKWICLLNEFRMFALTHVKYHTKRTGLQGCMETFKITDQYSAEKSATLKIILNNESYSDEQFEQIIRYCEEDVKILPIIAVKLQEISSKYGVTLAHRLERGRYSRNVALSQMLSNGFPMNQELTKAVFENIDKLKMTLAIQCNQRTGYEIYRPNYIGRSPNQVLKKYTFNFESFENYLAEKNLLGSWGRTEKGRLRTDEDYIDEMVSGYKTIIEPVYMARNSLKQLSSTDLTTLLSDDGYIHPEYAPFCQKTSRTSPYPSQGFVMNLCPWLRMLVKPKHGRVLIAIDYKSQEVLVAAALSKDKSMLEDYITDIYIGQAVKTNFLPKNAQKKTHKKERNAFKPIVLGTSYGMQYKSLTIHFFNFWKDINQPKSLDVCLVDAKNFLARHQKAYKGYYKFLSENEMIARVKGHLRIADHWFYFIDRNKFSPTAVKNSPIQGTAAEMLRQASNECMEKYQIPTIPHHDSLMVECAVEDAQKIAKLVSYEMWKASITTLGEEYGQYMNTETKFYDENTPYYDDRGELMFREISKTLGFECPIEFPQATDFIDIHK
jgi:DNA polymerase I-like protein with 3'-5' exonuclease and polymerase domains